MGHAPPEQVNSPVVTRYRRCVELSQAYRLHPSVALRPEPFGALVYHYGNRKLVFLKSPKIVAVVKSLCDHPSVDAAFAANAVEVHSQAKYLAALTSLERSDMLIAQVSPVSSVSPVPSGSEVSDGAAR
jgi:putative mycofactocin binding protein MftB